MTLEDLRLFRGNGFSVRVPRSWADLSVYALAGPVVEGVAHKIWVTVDEESRAPDSSVYARNRVRGILDSGPGWRLLLEEPLELEVGVEAVRADFRWCPSADHRAYRRYLLYAEPGLGLELCTQMTRKTRTMAGPVLDEVMRSFRPRPSHDSSPSAENETASFEADRFTLQHDESWADETTWVLADPDRRGFRRNLVVTKEALDEAPAALSDIAKNRLKGLAETTEELQVIAVQEVEVPGSSEAYALTLHRPTPEGGRLRQEVVMALLDTDLFLAVLSTEPPRDEEGADPLASLPRSLALKEGSNG